MFDIAGAIEKILPAAEYFGSTTENTEECWEAVDWRDARISKPTWAEVIVANELLKPTREEEIKVAISALEASVSERTKRGAGLGKPDDVARLQDVEDQITALRDELAGL